MWLSSSLGLYRCSFCWLTAYYLIQSCSFYSVFVGAFSPAVSTLHKHNNKNPSSSSCLNDPLCLAATTTTAWAQNQQQQQRQQKEKHQQQQEAAKLISSVVGDADRSFRRGVVLEANGQARGAAAAFHEAATLFSCCLDCQDEFHHVTALDRDEIPSVLAYTCTRLAHLNYDALGDAKAASRLYRMALDFENSSSSSSSSSSSAAAARAVALDGIGTTLEAAHGDLETAVSFYKRALEQTPKNAEIAFHLGVALERLGRTEESEEWLEALRRSEIQHSCLVDCWGYVRWHTRKVENANLMRGTRDMLEMALAAASPLIEQGGMVCEFGVASGRSIRMTQQVLPLDVPIHGFDTFTGLPSAWGTYPAGTYSTGGMIPNMEGQVYFHKGLFSDTIPKFLAKQPNDRVLAYANIDCELYTSTLDILEGLFNRIVPGTVLVFDEYMCHSTWRHDEFRAWRECCKRFGWSYEYLGFSLKTQQAVVRVTRSA